MFQLFSKKSIAEELEALHERAVAEEAQLEAAILSHYDAQDAIGELIAVAHDAKAATFRVRKALSGLIG